MFYRNRISKIERRTGRLEQSVAVVDSKMETMCEDVKYIRKKLDGQNNVSWTSFIGILALVSGVVFGVLKATMGG